MARFLQDDFPYDKSKLDNLKPRVLISIGIQEEKNVGNDLQEDCSKRKNYCKHNQGWQLQQPIYVEEPTWIDVDIDYIDSPQRVGNVDPYILSRGKKIYRIKDPEQVIKAIEDYEATLGYPSKNQRLLIKDRVRRTAKTNEESQAKTADVKNNRIKERKHYNSLLAINTTAIVENRGEKSSKIDKTSEAETPKDTSYIFIKKYEKDDLTKRLLRGFKFTKQNQSFTNDIVTDFIEQKQKVLRDDIPKDTDSSKTAKIGQIERIGNGKSRLAINEAKRSALPKNLPEIRKKRELYEIDTTSEKDVEKNETYEQMKTKDYVNELNDRYTPDNLFILSRDKNPFHNGVESWNKKNSDRNKSIERAWKLRYAHHETLEEDDGKARSAEDRYEINKDGVRITDSQLTNEPDSKYSETRTSNYRAKRTVCKTCKIKAQLQDEWLRNIEKEIQKSLSLERRDKHSDILERLSEPYIISRGKKVPRDFEQDDVSSKTSRDLNDEDLAKMMRLPENLLRVLLMEAPRCNNDNCDILNANRLLDKRLPVKDRRGTLDEIFETYDPYYVARGKRRQMGRNQQDSFDMDGQ